MSISVENSVALVTGANRGIGKAIVESLLNHGAKKVYLAVRSPESTTELAQRFGDKVVTLRADVGDDASVNALAEAAQDVQIVVHNAGVLEFAAPLDSHFREAFTHELEVNLYGLLRVAQAFTPIMERNGGGALVQLNSVASVVNFTPFTSYSASKAATYSITQGLKAQLAEKGIHVVSVHPGPIATDMGAKAGFEGEDVSVVSEGIITALKQGDFFVFPDSMAQNVWSAYQAFAEAVVTPPAE